MEQRLRNRKTESESKIKERVAKAEKELQFAKDFDVILLNDVLEEAQKEAMRLSKKHQKNNYLVFEFVGYVRTEHPHMWWIPMV